MPPRMIALQTPLESARRELSSDMQTSTPTIYIRRGKIREILMSEIASISRHNSRIAVKPSPQLIVLLSSPPSI